MRKIGGLILFALILVLSACGSGKIDGKLNKEGGFILEEDHALEVLDFDVNDGKGTVNIKRYVVRYYFDEDDITESVEQYKVTVEDDEISIHTLITMDAKLIDDELHLYNKMSGDTKIYRYANQKEIDKLLEELEEKFASEEDESFSQEPSEEELLAMEEEAREKEEMARLEAEAEAAKVYDTEGEKLYSQSCASCHGGDLSGGFAPDLRSIGSNMSVEEIEKVIVDGMGTMPPGILSGDEAKEVAKWLSEMK